MIRLFGGLSFEPANPQQGEFAPRRVAMLFAALALAGPRGMRREQLCALFWQDRPEPQARSSRHCQLKDFCVHFGDFQPWLGTYFQ